MKLIAAVALVPDVWKVGAEPQYGRVVFATLDGPRELYIPFYFIKDADLLREHAIELFAAAKT